MKDLALLILRVVCGGLIAGHGAQKLFGWFGGNGLGGTAGWLESMGLRPGQRWAIAAGGSEFGGGLLTALGLLSPLGPIGMISAMATAAGTAHAGKKIWVTEGGAELPVTNMAVASGLAMVGPGRLSADALLRIRLSPLIVLLAAATAVAGVGLAISRFRAHREAGAPADRPEATGRPDSTRPAATQPPEPQEATPITEQVPAVPVA